MPIRSIADLRRQAGKDWDQYSDEDLINSYAEAANLNPVEVANTLGYRAESAGAGITGQRFRSAFDQYQAGLYGLGEAVTGGLGFTGAQESLAARRRANEFEAQVAAARAREQGAIESFRDVQGIGDVPSYIAGLAIQSTPYIAEAAAGGLATRGLMSGTRAAFGQAVQAGDIPAAQAARQTLRRGMTVGGAVATYPSSVGEILQAQREQAGTTDLGVAGALGVPFAALNVLGIEGAAARLGGFRSVGRALDEVPGIRGAVTRAGATGLRVGTQESIAEVGQEGVSQFGRMAVDPQEEFFSPEAQERFKESAIGGFLLGKSLGAAAGGWRRSGEPIDLTRNIEPQVRQADAEARGLVRPGAGLSTQDLVNQITGVTRPEGTRPTRESMEAALNEPTGQMVAGPGGIERPQTAGDVYGVPPAPTAQAGAAQQAAQQTQGAQQAAQVEQAVIQQTAQAYGVRQVPPGPGVPTQAFNIAGRTVIGVPRVNQIVREIAQANQNKSPERVQLEAAIVASGLPLSGQATSKSILSSIDGAIKKYQLDGAATLNDAANILEFQIGQAKSAKAAEPMARIYEALTGQMSAAFQQLMEGPKPAATAAPLTPPASLGLMTGQAAPTPTPAAEGEPTATQPTAVQPTATQPTAVQPTATQPTGAPSGQPTPRAAAPAPTAAPAPAAQAQPIRAAQPVSPAPSARTEEVTAGAQAWEDMNVSTVQYSDLSEQDRAVWDQAVAEGRATGEIQEQLAKEYELIQEQGFMQQVLDRIIGRVIKSPNKARYFSTFLAAGARQQDIIARAEANAQRGADGKLTEAAQAEIKRLNQSLSALRGAPNPELAAEYGVALDTLKEWNKELRSFLIAKAPQLQEAARVVSVELKLEGGDLRNILSSMVARNQQAQTELQEAVQPDEVVFDERDLAVEDAGVTAQERTTASVQEVFNASETINARYLRLQQELVDAENAGNQELADEITARLDALTEDAAKQATKQAGKRPVKEKKDAVQKRETEKVSVQPGARGGEKVGKEVRGAEKPAAKGEAKTEREVTAAPEVTPTTAETAESAWTELRSSLPQEIQESIPAWRNLTKAQKDAATEFGADLNMRNVEKIVQTSGTTRFSMRPGAKGSNAATLRKSVVDFIGADNERKLVVVQTVKDIDETVVAAVEAETGPIVDGTQGFVHEGKAYLIASNIEPGTERAVFMHEVGSHLGLENILSEQQFDTLVDKILDWSQRIDDSLENKIAVKALKRVIDANPPMAIRNTELIAYFIEEAVIAGVDPTAAQTQAGFGSWFRTLWSAFKRAIRKLGFNPEKMDAFDVVNLAYGAARLEIAGTWHGTAAKFRRFDHQFMGRGEGAQAYGWGTYVAQRAGIAHEYMIQDTARKKFTSYSGRFLDDLGPLFKDNRWQHSTFGKVVIEPNAVVFIDAGATDPNVPFADLYVEAKVGNMDEVVRLIDLTADTEFGKRQIPEHKLRSFTKALTSPTRPTGNLLRVDINAKQDELLNWDIPIQDQPAIVKKLKADPVFQMILNEFDQGAGFTFNSAADLFTSDGSYFYRGLVELVEYGQFSTILDAIDRGDKATQKLKSDEVVSAFLDSIGIKGIKFLDASSRIKPKSFYKQQIETLKLLAQAEKETEEAFGIKPKLNPEEFKLRIAEIQKKLEKAPEDYTLTRNIVVFNDKNIFRVASLPEAKREQVKFSIAPAQEFAAQASLSAYQTRRRNSSLNVPGVPETVRSAGQAVFEAISNWTRKGIDRVVFTEALIKRAVESGISAASEFKNLIQERGVMARKLEQEVEKIADMYALVPESDRGTKEFSVNTFIYDSTRTKKWGFQPKWRATAVTVDPDMRDRFNALKPESQAFIRAVFQHGDKMLALKKKSVMDFTNSEYDAQIKLAQADGNAELVASLQKDKIADLKKFDTLFKLREGIPYAPLRRVGKYAVVAKSPEFRAAEEKGDNKALRLLEQDPNHYHVSFVDTDIQARNLQRQLQDQGFYGTDQDAVYFFEREKFQDELYGGDNMLAALSKLRSRVEDTDRDPKITAQLRRTITDMYLHALADASARKSELRRRAVPGEIDMLQSFTLQGRADAHFLSAVQYNDQTQRALQRMRKQAKTGGDRTRKAEVLNELTGRYLQSLEYEPTALVQKLTRVSSIYFLASSPGYYLQNLTQPWMMSLPVMAGRHDYTKSANALYNAYFDLKEVMKSAKLFDQQFDFSKVPDDVKEVIETLVNRSQIDIGLSTEMGEFRIEGQGPVSDRWNKVDKALRLAVQKVESVNRLSTAIAAYRLELAKTGDKAGAIDYASSIINDTHGDYSGFNAPRMFNTNIGKVALQFRKFQLIQLGLLAKLFKNSFGKAVTREQKVEQAIARRALTYILGQTAIITGVMGMPGAAAIAWALEGLFGDEDEPLDIKGSIRDFIGNDDIANLVLYGTPNLAGVNLSGKIGMGNALSVMPFTEIKDINGEKTAQIVGTLLGGPALGMGMRMADGYAYIAAGDLYKGMELMLPKGVGDAMRGVRVYSEGFTNRRGDVLLPADQIGEITAFWQGIGLSPTQTSVRGEKQARVINLEQKFSDRSSSIKRAYAEAAKDRNNERMAELRADWRNLQEARVRNGYPRRPISELLRAPQEQRQRERQVVEGVPYTESSRRFVERIANQ